MNCKPGDMAIVVSARAKADEDVLGAIVTLTTVDGTNVFGDVLWNFKEAPLRRARGDIIALCDVDLRPIRGLPADDEMTTEKEKQHEHAA